MSSFQKPSGVPHISDMRIVLLGNRREGKSSSGNTILGREEFDTVGRTAECVKREGETAGRHITVVEAPGWWKNYTVEETPEHDKQEIVLSVSLCPPGPHALLLVINVSRSFTETHRRAVQEHMELLGERVWSHTIVLFTRGDCLGDTSIEQHIESGGEALQWVVEKCGNRYHVVNNKKRDGGQVTELLEKIEEMVAGNRACPFQFKQSMEVPPSLKEHMPDHSSGSSCGYDSVSDLTKTITHLSVAASTQSSGYGTGEPEESGTGHTGTVIQRVQKQGGGEVTQKDVKLRPQHEKKQSLKIQDRLKKIAFVDVSTITVNEKECIGAGSFGQVYRGSYQGAAAAIKIISLRKSSVISNEFVIPLRLSHPNIVRMLAVARSETQILIANEYIHGANLHEVLYQDTSESPKDTIMLEHKDKLSVALDIAMALEYIHEKQIIHQDLNPANIMIAADTRKAYLTDWGMANCKVTISITLGSPLGGTPPYMAPECLVECEECSTMSDMWSLGITLLEMFTNSEPWTVSNAGEIRRLLHKRQRPHALDKLQPNLHDIVKPLIEYEPSSRMNAKDLVVLLWYKSKVDVS